MTGLIVRNPADLEARLTARPSMVFTPRFDVRENDNELTLVGDLPGVSPENLEVTVENQELRIWGKVEPRHPELRPWKEEYGVGDYYRSFTLGDMLDQGAIDAQLSNGVLTIRVPKKAEARPRKIAIKAD